MAEAKKKETRKDLLGYYIGTGEEISVTEDPRIRAITHRLCDRLGMRRPARIGYAEKLHAEARFSSSSNWANTALVVGKLGKDLDDDMLEAVIAHELGHAKHNARQTRNAKFMRLLSKMPIPKTTFKRICGWLSQRQEYAADRFMVQAVGKEKAAALFRHFLEKEAKLGRTHKHDAKYATHPSTQERFERVGGDKALRRYEAERTKHDPAELPRRPLPPRPIDVTRGPELRQDNWELSA